MTRGRLARTAFLAILFSVPMPLVADDLTGSSKFLCTAVQATRCTDDGDCVIQTPWNLNVPQFIEVDLKAGTLSTTKASGEDRSTPIKNSERADGQLFLQGVQRGRAFSFVINEETGMASIAVAAEGIAVSVFGACTPMAEDK